MLSHVVASLFEMPECFFQTTCASTLSFSLSVSKRKGVAASDKNLFTLRIEVHQESPHSKIDQENLE